MGNVQAKVHEDGSQTLRIHVPTVFCALAREVGTRFGADGAKAIEMVLVLLADSIDATNGSDLPATLAKAYEHLLVQDRVPRDGLPPMDIGKLHRSSRKNSASGFVGVYPNGRNFRAMARSPNGGPPTSIGTFPTAERAAWARYLHYTKHKLPYGELEEILDGDKAGMGVVYWRKQLKISLDREPTDLEVLAQVNHALHHVGEPMLPAPEGVTLPPPPMPIYE